MVPQKEKTGLMLTDNISESLYFSRLNDIFLLVFIKNIFKIIDLQCAYAFVVC